MKSSNIEFLNPEGMHQNPAFSQAVVVTGPVKIIYIGGQNAVNAKGEIVGKGDLEAQTKQVVQNLKTVLEAAGAKFENVIKWTLYVVQGHPLEAGYKVFQQSMSGIKHPPIISMAYVAALANPDFLLEMEAVAVVPES